MSKYLITGTTTPEFASAMLSTPQNRLDVVKPFFDQVGMELIDIFYTSAASPNFFAICTRALNSLKWHGFLPNAMPQNG